MAHRLPKLRHHTQRPVIVRFVRRVKRTDFLKQKSKLQERNPSVSINQDLTSARNRAVGILRSSREFERVYSIDGNILLKEINGGKLVIRSLLDLIIALNWSYVNVFNLFNTNKNISLPRENLDK